MEKEGAALAAPSQGDEDGGSEMVRAGSRAALPGAVLGVRAACGARLAAAGGAGRGAGAVA